MLRNQKPHFPFKKIAYRQVIKDARVVVNKVIKNRKIIKYQHISHATFHL